MPKWCATSWTTVMRTSSTSPSNSSSLTCTPSPHSCPGRDEPCREPLVASQDAGRSTRGAGFEPEVGEAVEQRAQPDLALHPRERGTEAVVASGGEGDVVASVRAADVERARVLEDIGVAVGAGQQGGDNFAVPDGYAGDDGVRRAQPAGQQDRRVDAEDLVDGVGPQRRVLP